MTYIKQFIIVLFLLTAFSYADEPSTGIMLGNTAIPNGAFPSHVGNKGYGGWHITTNEASIPEYLLTDGTAAYNTLTDEIKIYNGVSWDLFTSGATNSGGSEFTGSYTNLTDIPPFMDTDSRDDFDGSFTNLTDVPVAYSNEFDGSFNSLSDVPEALTNLFDGSYNSLDSIPQPLTDLAGGEVNNVIVQGDSYTVITVGVEETIPGQCYSLETSGWQITDSTNTYGGLLGIAIGESSANGMIIEGVISSRDLIPGTSLYLCMTNSGGFTTTQPTNSGEIIRYVGSAITYTKIYFNPSSIYLENE